MAKTFVIRRFAILFCVLCLTWAANSYGDDVVLDWNEMAMAAIATSGEWGPRSSRSMAMIHVAMFDAVNGIDGRYEPYRVRSRSLNASREAAAITAAHYVLSKLYPLRRGHWDKAYKVALGRVREGAEKDDGVNFGREVGSIIWSTRMGDGADSVEVYKPFANRGSYVPTVLPIDPQWMEVKPWLLERASQFRVASPPALKSRRWATDFNEVKSVGESRSQRRNREQTRIAQFWTLAGPATYNPFLRQLAQAKGGDIVDKARAFALVHLSLADTYIAVWDSKYSHHFWRPVTAIRRGNEDDNPDTEPDYSWLPAIITPMHPEYPCAHCAVIAAAVTVLEEIYGSKQKPLFLVNPEMPGFKRRYENLRQVVDEVTQARIWGGVHYRFSNDAGVVLGENVGRYAVKHYLRKVQQPIAP